MSIEEAAPETKGVTAELLTTVDLGPEIEGMAGRQLRMRMFTFEPGAVFGPIHGHKNRPGIVCILQGTITDHRNGAATDYGPGVGWPEDRNTTHWLETEERFRRWKSRSISSGLPNSSAVGVRIHPNAQSGKGWVVTLPPYRHRLAGTVPHFGVHPASARALG
jgi:quercetin dioxygenase-like cupin family protein